MLYFIRKLLRGRYQQEPGEAKWQPPIKAAPSYLEKPIDPLIAAHVHNIQKGRLGSLPEEILLSILDQIGDDIVTLYCLRRVSRVFRRMICEPRIWRHLTMGAAGELDCLIPRNERRQLKQHLKRDGACDECKLLCKGLDGFLSGESVQDQELNTENIHDTCRFDSKSDGRGSLHCSPCGTHHDSRAFSFPYQDPDRRGMRCLGRHGAVQLCEHVHVSWADIENHIATCQKRRSRGWLKRRPERWQVKDWKACLDHFELECHHPSHDMRCSTKETPTWPRARLRRDNRIANGVVLALEWRPHSGLDAFTKNAKNLTPVTELRELFQRYRRGPARIFLPSYPSMPLPEMACYGPSQCRCLYYEGGGGKALGSGFFRPYKWLCVNTHFYQRYTWDGRGEGVSTADHWPRGMDGPACLITSYECRIPLFTTDHNYKVNPSHAWLHAMDPDTYPRPPRSHELPLCKDAGCMNYYRRPKTFHCCFGPRTIHYPCMCWEIGGREG